MVSGAERLCLDFDIIVFSLGYSPKNLFNLKKPI